MRKYREIYNLLALIKTLRKVYDEESGKIIMKKQPTNWKLSIAQS